MFKCGEKFTIENCTIDVEITGYFPKSQNKDGKDYYVATLNGEKMKISSSFLEMLQKSQKKQEEKTVKAEEVKEEEKFVDADLKVQSKPVIVRVKEEEEEEENKPKKEVKKNGRRK